MEQHQCLANADHLYGLAAECGLKCLMRCFGMDVDGTGRPTKSADLKHADHIWLRYESYRQGHVSGTVYALGSCNPFNNWRAEQRYAHRNLFDQARIDPHRDAARRVNELLSKEALIY